MVHYRHDTGPFHSTQILLDVVQRPGGRTTNRPTGTPRVTYTYLLTLSPYDVGSSIPTLSRDRSPVPGNNIDK